MKAIVINGETVTLLNSETLRGLSEQIAIMNDPGRDIIDTDEGYVSSVVFEEIMGDKGYHVTTLRAKKRRCEEFDIKKKKRGKEWWFRLVDIEKVPRRRASRNRTADRTV